MIRGAGVIAIKDDKVLLVKAGISSRQPNGTVSFPGGRIEGSETEEITADREFTEETGFTAERLLDFPGNYVEAIVPTKKGELKVSFKVFLVTNFFGTLTSTEETEPIWMPTEEARKMKLYGKNNELLENALKFLNKL